MSQINFRINSKEREILDLIAKMSKKSVSALAKELVLSGLEKEAKKISLELYKLKKIGLKKAWQMSQMTFPEFLTFLNENECEPEIPENLDDEMIDIAESLRFEDLFPGKKLSDIKKINTEVEKK